MSRALDLAEDRIVDSAEDGPGSGRYPQILLGVLEAASRCCDDLGMGIRYYAYPVDAEHIEAARRDPWAFLSDDPLADAWGLHAENELPPPRPQMLYLDKCWSRLQRLTQPCWDDPPRPAHELVRGNVTMRGYGWEPCVQVLGPEQVEAISHDIDTIGDEEIIALVNGQDVGDWEADYVRYFLREAQRFTAELAGHGQGLVYLIG